MTPAQKRILFAVVAALLITGLYGLIIHFAGLTVGVLAFAFTTIAAQFYMDWE